MTIETQEGPQEARGSILTASAVVKPRRIRQDCALSGVQSAAAYQRTARPIFEEASRMGPLEPWDWQLAEFAPGLRQYVEKGMADEQVILARLAWPDDLFYDLAAWQRSGVDDPIALGIINNPLEVAP